MMFYKETSPNIVTWKETVLIPYVTICLIYPGGKALLPAVVEDLVSMHLLLLPTGS